MKLEMYRGLESSLLVEDVTRSIEHDGFLADSYTKALDALCCYVQYSNVIRHELSQKKGLKSQNEILYRSTQNIIAFSGKRGTGKTSTMLSFSNALKNPQRLEKHYPELHKRNFVVLDPIDPTMLETNQSILSVVLSRLLFRAEEIWNQSTSFYGGFQEKETEKIELLTLARQCLNGINALKSGKGIISELSELQKMGDSSILKKNLYILVDLFIRFLCVGKDIDVKDCILVLQIDDTDCQISQGYEVMEDIRKYLTIPNVLILMATDIAMLRQVLTQHYISDFDPGLKQDLVKLDEVRSLGEKYMAKLLPPTHVIHLPNIDKCIRNNAERIHLYYYTDESSEENLLSWLPRDEEFREYELQTVFLRYIYKKTHIVFTAHDSYANNIIPTTLRGLAYLLSLLSSMEDVPEIDFTKKTINQSDTEYLIEKIQAQIPVLENNLSLFEDYFLNYWLHAKLPQDMIEIVEKLSNQVPDQRNSFLVKELVSYYTIRGISAFQFQEFLDRDASQYSTLDELLRTIQGTKKDIGINESFREAEDFYFIFAIRTLLTIKNNRDVLIAKRKAINNFNSKSTDKIVFNFLSGKTSLPTSFYLDPVDLFGHHLVRDLVGTSKESRFGFYFQMDGLGTSFNFTGGVIQWLAPQEKDYEGLSQQEIYRAQELAALMAANCDVQEAARKEVARETRRPVNTVNTLADAVEKGLLLIQNTIAQINQGMFEQYKSDNPQKSSWTINEEFTATLNSLKKDRTYEQSQKDMIDNPKKQAETETYPKVEFEPYKTDHKKRMEQFENKRAEYKSRLMDYCEKTKVDLDKRSSDLLNQLMEYEPEYSDGRLQNLDTFRKITDELNNALENFFKGHSEQGKSSDKTQTAE